MPSCRSGALPKPHSLSFPIHLVPISLGNKSPRLNSTIRPGSLGKARLARISASIYEKLMKLSAAALFPNAFAMQIARCLLVEQYKLLVRSGLLALCFCALERRTYFILFFNFSCFFFNLTYIGVAFAVPG